MKKKKNMIALMLICCLILGIHSNVSAFETIADNIDPEDMFEIQREACLANEVLYKSFEWDGTYIYPDDFAGTYIDYDTLYILVTEGGSVEKYTVLLADYSNVEYQFVPYSYNTLYSETQRVVEEELADADVVCYGVDVIENRGYINVLKDASAKKHLRSYKENDMIYIEQVDDDGSDEASLIGGSPILTSGNWYLTLGGSGTYNGSVAFLTCGHDVVVGDSLMAGRKTFATASLVRVANNQSGDFSISTAASGYTASSSVLSSGGMAITYQGYLLNPTVGTYLYKYGAVGGEVYCQVTETGVTWKDTCNLTVAKIISGSSELGDSGGPYRSGGYFCGVHKGTRSEGSDIYVYFTPYTYIYDAGFRIKTGATP